MSAKVAEDVFSRVEALVAAGAASRAAAIRQVAAESGRTESAVGSAYYAARRAGGPAAGAAAPAATSRSRPGRRGRSGSDSARLYAEMLPLVEAGASVEQAARRFGDEDSVAEISAGFLRWREREWGLGRVAAPSPRPAPRRRSAPEPVPAPPGLDVAVRDAEDRITALEAENRELRRELTRARQAITRVRAILDSASS